MADVAIALSVLLSFILYEGLGLLAGGMVSAGYLSQFFEQPLRLVSTLTVAAAVCLFMRALSLRVILFGRRRFMLTMMISLTAGWVVESLLRTTGISPVDLRIIGHVVPGLIANDMYKQGIFRTLLGVLLSAALIRLVLFMVYAR